jgi:hypothetical protein
VAETDEDFAYFRATPEAGTGGLVYGRVKKLTIYGIAPITDVRSTQHYLRTVMGNALAKILRRQM